MINEEHALSPTEEQIRAYLMQRYLQIPNTDHHNLVEKSMGLRSLGCSEATIEALCRPKELARKEVMKTVAESCAADRKKFRREYLASRPPKPRRPPKLQPAQDPNVCCLG